MKAHDSKNLDEVSAFLALGLGDLQIPFPGSSLIFRNFLRSHVRVGFTFVSLGEISSLGERRQGHRLWWSLVGVGVERGQRVWAVGEEACGSDTGSDRCRTRVSAVSCSGRDSKAHIIFPVFAKVFQV